MGRAGDCVTCCSRQRQKIEAARAKGESYASLGRRFSLAESSIRRHFKEGHARKREPRTASRPAAPTTAKPFGSWVTTEPAPTMTFSELRESALSFPVPLAVLVCAVYDVMLVDLTTASDDESDELDGLLAEGQGLLAGLRLEY